MKRFLILILLFCASQATAQPFLLSENREPVRAGMIAYPTAAEALTGGIHPSKYLTTLDQWARTEEDTHHLTDFTVPFAWANRQVLLHVESASADYDLFVNGKPAGRNANPNAPADFNITKLVREGRNQLEIRLARLSALAPLESWKQQPATPALGRTYLLSQPTMRIGDVVTKTWIADDGMKAEIGLIIRSSALNPRTSRIHYELIAPSGDAVAKGHKELKLDMRREDTLRLVASIPDTLQWSAAHPVRHTLRLKTQHEGRYVEYLNLQLGLRTIATQGNQLLINGNPVILHAVEVAPSITPQQIVDLHKQGFNTLKLHAGITPDTLYQICDSIGIYVIAQAPIDSRTGGSDIRLGGNPSNDPAWLPAYIERTADTYHATQRHPSVIAFSLAEKSANGINLYESYLNMKRLSDPRPIIYRDAEGQWNNDPLMLEMLPQGDEM